MNIPIEKMTVAEKLQAIEQIWDSLVDSNPEAVPSPDWHREELVARGKRLESGETTISTWDEAEKRFDNLGK